MRAGVRRGPARKGTARRGADGWAGEAWGGTGVGLRQEARCAPWTLTKVYRPVRAESGGGGFGLEVAQDPAALGNGLDELRTARRHAELLAQLGDEHVDDLGLRLVVG